jgi:hypothetical protein
MTDRRHLYRKTYKSYVNSSGRRILCNSEGHALRPMTSRESKSWYSETSDYMPYRMTDKEYDRGTKENEDSGTVWP